MISSSQHDSDFLATIVEDLSQKKYPHDIEGGFQRAERHARKVLTVVKSIENSIILAKNLAHVQINSELPSSMVVNFVSARRENQLHLYTRPKRISIHVLSLSGDRTNAKFISVELLTTYLPHCLVVAVVMRRPVELLYPKTSFQNLSNSWTKNQDKAIPLFAGKITYIDRY